MLKLLQSINNFSLYIVVFTVVFENWDPLGTKGSQSITYFATLIYIASWLPLLRTNLRIGLLKRFAIPLFLFIVIGIISTALNSAYASNLEDLFKTRFYQLIVLTLLIANHIFIEKDIIWKVLLIYIITVFLMNILVILGYGITYELGRINIFGENPNSVGTKAVVAFIFVLAFLYNRKHSYINIGISIVLIMGFLSLIILSASRGALLALFLGTFTLTVLKKMSKPKKMILFSLGLSFIIFFFQYVIETNEVFRERITSTIKSGDIGRNDLWNTAWQIIQDNLVIGVGVPNNAFLTEMYKYGGRFMGPHNIFLYVLMTTGVIGFFFFMLFLIRLGKDLFRGFRHSNDAVFLTTFILILLFWSKEGGAIGSIYSWFFIAILIGSTLIIEDKKKFITNN